jgi:lambda family phage portal protein
VELDVDGVPVAYHLYKRNPNDVYVYDTQPERVPAGQILHLFQQKRIGQTRGMSDFAPIVQWIRDLDEYMTTEMKAALVASCFSVAIKTVSAGADGGIEGLGQDDTAEDDGAVFSQLKSGLVARLFPDESVETINPSRGHTDSAVWVTLMQRAMAVGAGLSYERLTRDYSQTNFSSNRASDLEDRKEFRFEQDWLTSHLCIPVWIRFVMAAVDAGVPGFPTPMQLLVSFDQFTAHEWQPQGWEWVDPKNEATAAHQALEDDTTTVRDELSKKGNRDWREIMRQRAIEKAYQQELVEEFGLSVAGDAGIEETENSDAEENEEDEADEGQQSDAVSVGDDSARRG